VAPAKLWFVPVELGIRESITHLSDLRDDRSRLVTVSAAASNERSQNAAKKRPSPQFDDEAQIRGSGVA
jgi:hypothetical protein